MNIRETSANNHHQHSHISRSLKFLFCDILYFYKGWSRFPWLFLQPQLHKQSINSLHQEIIDLQTSIDLKSQNVVNNSHKLQNLEKAANSQQLPEIKRLRTNVQSKRNEVMEILEKHIQNKYFFFCYGDHCLILDSGSSMLEVSRLVRWVSGHLWGFLWIITII